MVARHMTCSKCGLHEVPVNHSCTEWLVDRPDPKKDERDPIIHVSGFGVANTPNTQCDYMLVGLTQSGRVVMSTGDGHWADVSPKD